MADRQAIVHSSVEFKHDGRQPVDEAPNSLTKTFAQLYKSEQRIFLRVTRMRTGL
jgi:hypothetical protein